MIKRTTTPVSTFTATNGCTDATVRLAGNAGTVRIHHDDFLSLQAQGFNGSWYLNFNTTKKNGYVPAQMLGGNNVTLSRLVADAGPMEHVHHKDGDNRNLKRGNLAVHKGRNCSKRCTHHRSFQG